MEWQSHASQEQLDKMRMELTLSVSSRRAAFAFELIYLMMSQAHSACSSAKVAERKRREGGGGGFNKLDSWAIKEGLEPGSDPVAHHVMSLCFALFWQMQNGYS